MNLRGVIGVALGALIALGGCAGSRAANPGDPSAKQIGESLTGPIIFPHPSQIFNDVPESP